MILRHLKSYQREHMCYTGSCARNPVFSLSSGDSQCKWTTLECLWLLHDVAPSDFPCHFSWFFSLCSTFLAWLVYAVPSWSSLNWGMVVWSGNVSSPEKKYRSNSSRCLYFQSAFFPQALSLFDKACASSLESFWINAYRLLMGVVVVNLLALSFIAWEVPQLFPWKHSDS